MGLIQLLSDAEDIQSGVVETMQHDPYDDIMVVKKEQDCSSILNLNKKLHNDYGIGYTPRKDFKKVASIPNIVIEQWMQDGINIFDKNDWPKIAAKLDDPGNLYLRTSPGTISKKPLREHYTTRGVSNARKLL